MAEALWTWGGVYFGRRDGNELWNHDGRHVGRFDGDEIYGPDGRYLGELRNENRLITATSKRARQRSAFAPWTSRASLEPHAGYERYPMHAGFQDFPAPEELAR
jgi:hypothetical protein